jgi:predicted component of type VI protein secretion system
MQLTLVLVRVCLVTLCFAECGLLCGCGSAKEDSKTNPEFTVPDIPPGKRELPGENGKATKKNK